VSEPEKSRLLVLTSSFPRWANDTDPRFIEELCYELAAAHDVTVLAPHCRGAARRETLARGSRMLDVRRFRYCPAIFETLAYGGGILANLRRNPLRVLLVPLFMAGELFAAIRLHRERRFAAIHAHWLVPQGIVAALLGRLPGRPPPVLVTAHGSDLATLSGAVLSRLKRWVLRSADSVSVVSEALRQDAVDLGCEPHKIHVASMGVDLDTLFTPDDGRERDGLLCVGKLDADKGVGYLLRAFAVLAAANPGLTLVLVGDGPERPTLEALARELGIAERVVFRGALPQERIPGLLRAARVAVVPSLREGLGLVAVEALGCGCAVVASDLPALREVVIDGETGLLARPGDADELAAKIAELLADGGLRERLARNGRDHVVARFAWPAVGRGYRGLIGELAARNPANQ
jgi:glycosyltransferase involved in cell wall biosynthesis